MTTSLLTPWMTRAFALSLPALCACVNATEPSSWNRAFGEREVCPGAFSPHSDECWDSTKPTPTVVMADRVKTEEFGDEIGNQDRCAMLLGQVPGVEGSLTISFNTVPLGGTYGPRNCGAVWIEDAMRNYIRTVEVWVKERHDSITMWQLRNCDTDPTVADVVTSATLDNHILHEKRVWDTKDWRDNVVPDGMYTLWLQVTENEIVPEGPYIQVPFMKGTQPFKTEVPAADGFTNVVLEYVPTPVAPGATAP